MADQVSGFLETGVENDVGNEVINRFHLDAEELSDGTVKNRDGPRVEIWSRVRSSVGSGGSVGKGGFGTAWLERRADGALRVVKEVEKDSADPKKKTHYWVEELRAMAILSKEWKHFPVFYGWFHSPVHVYIAMEYFALGDLHRCVEGSLPIQECRLIVDQVAKALDFMHTQNFIHRDLKPTNILVRQGPPIWDVAVADFGLSKKTTITELNTSIYTPFAAPEILGCDIPGNESPNRYTNAVDAWSLGCLAYWLLHRTFPIPVGNLGLYCSTGWPEAANKIKWGIMDCLAQAFILALLRPIPQQRMSAVEARAHDWLLPAQELPPGYFGTSGKSDYHCQCSSPQPKQKIDSLVESEKSSGHSSVCEASALAIQQHSVLHRNLHFQTILLPQDVSRTETTFAASPTSFLAPEAAPRDGESLEPSMGGAAPASVYATPFVETEIVASGTASLIVSRHRVDMGHVSSTEVSGKATPTKKEGEALSMDSGLTPLRRRGATKRWTLSRPPDEAAKPIRRKPLPSTLPLASPSTTPLLTQPRISSESSTPTGTTWGTPIRFQLGHAADTVRSSVDQVDHPQLEPAIDEDDQPLAGLGLRLFHSDEPESHLAQNDHGPVGVEYGHRRPEPLAINTTAAVQATDLHSRLGTPEHDSGLECVSELLGEANMKRNWKQTRHHSPTGGPPYPRWSLYKPILLDGLGGISTANEQSVVVHPLPFPQSPSLNDDVRWSSAHYERGYPKSLPQSAKDSNPRLQDEPTLAARHSSDWSSHSRISPLTEPASANQKGRTSSATAESGPETEEQEQEVLRNQQATTSGPDTLLQKDPTGMSPTCDHPFQPCYVFERTDYAGWPKNSSEANISTSSQVRPPLKVILRNSDDLITRPNIDSDSGSRSAVQQATQRSASDTSEDDWYKELAKPPYILPPRVIPNRYQGKSAPTRVEVFRKGGFANDLYRQHTTSRESIARGREQQSPGLLVSFMKKAWQEIHN